MPLLFGRRSEVHVSGRGRSCAQIFHLPGMRAMHEEASAPTDDAEQVGPDVQTNSSPHTETL